MEKYILGFIIFIQSICFLLIIYVFFVGIFSKSGIPKCKNPPLPPPKDKCISCK